MTRLIERNAQIPARKSRFCTSLADSSETRTGKDGINESSFWMVE
jgi:hypothetical protein